MGGSRGSGGRVGRAGFSLVDFLIACCVLVIVLGLGVSLSREVRARSARVLTADLLFRLETLAEQYLWRTQGAMPGVPPFISQELDTPLSRPDQLRLATTNNRALVRVIANATGAPASDLFRDLPMAAVQGVAPELRDAWGTPIVYLPRSHPLLGMAPEDTGFFLSAGPDQDFFTRGDNLFSYDTFSRRRTRVPEAPGTPAPQEEGTEAGEPPEPPGEGG